MSCNNILPTHLLIFSIPILFKRNKLNVTISSLDKSPIKKLRIDSTVKKHRDLLIFQTNSVSFGLYGKMNSFTAG